MKTALHRFIRSSINRQLAPVVTMLVQATLLGSLVLQAVPGIAGVNLAAPAVKSPQGTRGIAIPIGGALKYDNDAVWKRIVDLAGGRGARFAVFATASDDPERSAERIIGALTKHGAVAEHIPVSAAIKGIDVHHAVRNPVLLAKVRGSRGVYFAGGAQERITDALYQNDGAATPMLAAIWEVFNKGGVVAGSSAGAAIMSATMFRDPPEVMDILRAGQAGLKSGRDFDRGLGFVGADIFVDQHFLKRGRIGRMLPLMLQTGYKMGFGVEENTAVIVQGDDIEVIDAKDSKGALVADLGAASVDASMPEFNISNVKLTYLDRGDRYNLKTKMVTPSAQKLRGKKLEPLAGGGKYNPYFKGAIFSPAILADGVIVNTMAQLIDSDQASAVGLAFAASRADTKAETAQKHRQQLGFEFTLRKGADSVGYVSSANGGEDYTVVNLYLDVSPVMMAVPLYLPLVQSSENRSQQQRK